MPQCTPNHDFGTYRRKKRLRTGEERAGRVTGGTEGNARGMVRVSGVNFECGLPATVPVTCPTPCAESPVRAPPVSESRIDGCRDRQR